MNYYHVAKEGYPIGSGDVEAANKVLVTHRLKRSGQHWGRDGGQGYFPFVRYSNLIASKEPSLWSCPEWSDQKTMESLMKRSTDSSSFNICSCRLCASDFAIRPRLPSRF